VERLGWWLCAGLAKLGALEGGDADAVATSIAADADHTDVPFGALRESRITYPLVVDAWQAVGEHLFEEQEDGVSVRYVHGSDRDRWIDVYFYPAGSLSVAQCRQAAQDEAELIRAAHVEAGHADFDLGRLRSFSLSDSGDMRMDGSALDLAYTADGVRYSSAMTLLLDRLYFVKARYSIEESKLTRRDAREQLQAFVAQMQPLVAIVNFGHGEALPEGAPARADAWTREAPGMRELRLEYHVAQVDPPSLRSARAVELSIG
jgi:hypothetical protein